MLLLQFSTLLKISVIMNSYYQFSVCWAPEAVVNFHLSLYLEAYFIDLFSYRDVLGFFPPQNSMTHVYLKLLFQKERN